MPSLDKVAADLVFVFRQLSPQTFPAGRYKPSAEELRQYPLAPLDFDCRTLRSAQFSLNAARRQYAKGWLTELEHRLVASRCLAAIQKLGG